MTGAASNKAGSAVTLGNPTGQWKYAMYHQLMPENRNKATFAWAVRDSRCFQSRLSPLQRWRHQQQLVNTYRHSTKQKQHHLQQQQLLLLLQFQLQSNYHQQKSILCGFRLSAITKTASRQFFSFSSSLCVRLLLLAYCPSITRVSAQRLLGLSAANDETVDSIAKTRESQQLYDSTSFSWLVTNLPIARNSRR